MGVIISIFALVVSLICANYTRMNISIAYRKDNLIGMVSA